MKHPSYADRFPDAMLLDQGDEMKGTFGLHDFCRTVTELEVEVVPDGLAMADVGQDQGG